MVAKGESVVDYARRLADMLGLKDWTIGLSDLSVDAPTGDELEPAIAQIKVTSGQQLARIRVGPGFTTGTPADQRSAIVHELLHCHLWPVEEAIDSIDELVGTSVAHVVEYVHHLAVERAVDAIAVAIAPFFPLPGGK